MTQTIIKVRVQGGLIQDIDIPKELDAIVQVYDYDVDKSEDTDFDEENKPCNISEWHAWETCEEFLV